MRFILGKKLEMSQIFDKEGKVVPVTLIAAGPCEVLEIRERKKEEKDNCGSIQIGFEELKPKKIKKTQKGKAYKHLREFKGDVSEYKLGQKINVSVFEKGDVVKVSGISKGKGFQGAVKKWGFAGMPASHGTKHHERTLGSTGSRYPQRVRKGKKMPGRMGYERITVKNLKIAEVDSENNLLAIKGAVPGRRGTLLEIRTEN